MNKQDQMLKDNNSWLSYKKALNRENVAVIFSL